ncbi:hypothetical protein V8E36_001114, partial [Tilletia maclaganii]
MRRNPAGRTPFDSILFSLPVRQGGCGVPLPSDLAPLARAASIQAATRFLRDTLGIDIIPFSAVTTIQPHASGQQGNGATAPAPAPAASPAAARPDPDPGPPSATQLTRRVTRSLAAASSAAACTLSSSTVSSASSAPFFSQKTRKTTPTV